MSPPAHPLRMVRLMTADDAFSAKVVAARLGVEGIVWELRGGVDGPYPIGPVHVFVDEADLAEAQAMLASTAPLDDDEDGGDERGAEDEPDADRFDRRALLLGAGLLVLLGLVATEVMRLVALR